MSGWAGFSDAELRKMQQQDSAMPAAAARGRKPVPANRSRQQLQRERALQIAVQKTAGAASLCLPPEQQLTKPPPREDPEPRPAAPPTGAPAVKQGVQHKPPEMKPAPEEETPAVKELETQEVALREKTRLEQLQQEQKVIEEKNKLKKALLTKTIAEKSKQTQAEAVKLKRIQKELQALDDMVSNDIGILRVKIEQASWDYSAARKRYEKAEVEYVTAKLDLHKKTEAKEQLTEHLCAIIQQNELRKAHKLEELMQQLQLRTTEEELEKQKEEEEEKKKEKKKIESCVEMQRDGKQDNGSVADQEGTVQSSKDCRPSEEETVTEESGGDVRQDHHPMTEPPKTDRDRQTLENCGQSGAAAS
ncbi:RAB6-interacting golgin [Cebidichthys violaceus]|uniref:RAB6-interacting golgin n=1 Tax=Cebidichthys violaceus TaxID=271503 RepID=UPI0035CA42BF